jgi:hypothetical protein
MSERVTRREDGAKLMLRALVDRAMQGEERPARGQCLGRSPGEVTPIQISLPFGFRSQPAACKGRRLIGTALMIVG